DVCSSDLLLDHVPILHSRGRALVIRHACGIWLKQRALALDPAHGVVVEDHASDAAVLGERARLRLNRLRSKHAFNRSEERVAVQKLQVPRQLLDSINTGVTLDLDSDVGS